MDVLGHHPKNEGEQKVIAVGQVRAVLDILVRCSGAEVFVARPFWADEQSQFVGQQQIKYILRAIISKRLVTQAATLRRLPLPES